MSTDSLTIAEMRTTLRLDQHSAGDAPMMQSTTLEFGRGKVFAIDGNGRVVWSGECTGLRLCVEANKPDEIPADASRVASITIGDCDLIGLRRKLDDLREPRPSVRWRERNP